MRSGGRPTMVRNCQCFQPKWSFRARSLIPSWGRSVAPRIGSENQMASVSHLLQPRRHLSFSDRCSLRCRQNLCFWQPRWWEDEAAQGFYTRARSDFWAILAGCRRPMRSVCYAEKLPTERCNCHGVWLCFVFCRPVYTTGATVRSPGIRLSVCLWMKSSLTSWRR